MPDTVALPNTCPINRRHAIAHVRLLSRVHHDAWSAAGFEGRLFRPGDRVSSGELGESPVLLECAGPQGNFHQGKARPILWVLWRYHEREWFEIARASALDWSWALILREPARRALKGPALESGELARRGMHVAEAILTEIETRLADEDSGVRDLVLTSMYDRIASKLVA